MGGVPEQRTGPAVGAQAPWTAGPVPGPGRAPFPNAPSAVPVQGSPVQSSPVQSSPVQSSPVQSSPVQSSPVQSSPVQSGPVQSSPVQSGPVQSGPVQGGPVQGQARAPPRPCRSCTRPATPRPGPDFGHLS